MSQKTIGNRGPILHFEATLGPEVSVLTSGILSHELLGPESMVLQEFTAPVRPRRSLELQSTALDVNFHHEVFLGVKFSLCRVAFSNFRSSSVPPLN